MRTGRAWIKVQLSISPDSKHAAEIVEYWRSLKQAAHHLTRAIRMYYALQVGDTRLLREYFPLLSMGMNAPVAPMEQPIDGEPEIRLVQRSDEDDLGNFFESLGLE